MIYHKYLRVAPCPIDAVQLNTTNAITIIREDIKSVRLVSYNYETGEVSMKMYEYSSPVMRHIIIKEGDYIIPLGQSIRGMNKELFEANYAPNEVMK